MVVFNYPYATKSAALDALNAYKDLHPTSNPVLFQAFPTTPNSHGFTFHVFESYATYIDYFTQHHINKLIPGHYNENILLDSRNIPRNIEYLELK
jgi:hypothetical protein